MSADSKMTYAVLISCLLLTGQVSPGFAGDSSQTTEADREEALIHKIAGDRYLKQAEPALAAAEYERALALNPKSSAACFNLAIAYYTQRNMEGAAAALKKLLALDPTDAEALYNLACIRIYQQEPDSARPLFERAKLCCSCGSKFSPLIRQGLEFLEDFKITPPSAQELVLFLLRKGLPPLSIGVTA